MSSKSVASAPSSNFIPLRMDWKFPSLIFFPSYLPSTSHGLCRGGGEVVHVFDVCWTTR